MALDRTSARAHAPTVTALSVSIACCVVVRSGINASMSFRSSFALAAMASSWSWASMSSERRKGCASVSGPGMTPPYCSQKAPPSPATASTIARARMNSHPLPESGAAADAPARTRGQAPSPGSARALPSCINRVSFFGTDMTTSPRFTGSDANRPLPCADWRTAALSSLTSWPDARAAIHPSSVGGAMRLSLSLSLRLYPEIVVTYAKKK
mmetsp:Transcript_1953/g.8813  ORF Transcript_1953/g.8813 Transcript_1953/m.8813 type:complete len:211 (+) Transcript_1953:1920-2552(+)